MPEGPSIVILREAAAAFRGRTVRRASGNSRVDLSRMEGRRIKAIRSWGKHFLIEFSGFSMRVHLLLFGTYRIDERKPSPPRMRLEFDRGELNFYACSLRYLEGPLDDAYDWSADVMSDLWDPLAARRRLRARPDMLVCDALLDQDLFAGVGNIIKNEVLYRVRVDPRSTVGALPAARLRALVDQARRYSFDFLAWKRAYVLKKHWLVHAKRSCPRGHGALVKEVLGTSQRRCFYCTACQKLYGRP